VPPGGGSCHRSGICGCLITWWRDTTS